MHSAVSAHGKKIRNVWGVRHSRLFIFYTHPLDANGGLLLRYGICCWLLLWWLFFFCSLWKYRFCVQAKTHLKLFVPPTEKQAFHFWQRSFSGCSYPCSLYPMTLCVTLRRRGSMIFSSVTFVWMEIKACARWHAHFCNTRVLLVQRIFKCSCNASTFDEQ